MIVSPKTNRTDVLIDGPSGRLLAVKLLAMRVEDPDDHELAQLQARIALSCLLRRRSSDVSFRLRSERELELVLEAASR